MNISIPDAQLVLSNEGFSLVTARIIYRFPDYKRILQEFTWQEYDLFPSCPNLAKFLDFWDRELEGPIHSIEVAHATLITPAEVRLVKRSNFLIN